MSDIVNTTSGAARDWQHPIVMIRVNIGFMLAETAEFANQGDSVADIEELLAKFNNIFAIFSQTELRVFEVARAVEIGTSNVPDLNAALEVMQKSFVPWFDELHDLITKRREKPRDIALTLLLTCGGEMLTAHTRFVNAVNAYLNSDVGT